MTEVQDEAGVVFEVVDKTPPLDDIENVEEIQDPETGAISVTTIEFEGETYDVGPDVYILKDGDGNTRLCHKNTFETQFTEVNG